MDKFTTRRRAAWQTKVPAWPFIAAAVVAAAAVGYFAGPYAGGMLLGDGTSGTRAIVWLKTASNIMIPALLVGVTLGVVLNTTILSPGGRHGAMTWTAVLVGVCALAIAPMAVARGIEADRLGYELRLRHSLNQSRVAAQRAENDYARRMGLLQRNQGVNLYTLAQKGGAEQSRKLLAGQKDLLASARRDYEKGQDEARAFLAKAIVGKADREAVLLRFDEARAERTPLMQKVFSLQERLIALDEAQIDLLLANRSKWRPSYDGGVVSDRALLNRLNAMNRERDAMLDEHDAASDRIRELDARTEAGIDRVLYAAAKIDR